MGVTTSSSIAQCRVAVVGAGYMAREHIRAFLDVPGVLLVGIHSRSRPRAEVLAAEFGIPTICDSIQTLAETGANLVVVTVPELAMRVTSLACFAYPWTVLLEKPAGYNLADAKAIRDAAASAGARAFVALNRRFHSSTKLVREDLDQLSGPRFIKIQDQEDLVAARANGQPLEVVENWMFANAIHIIDFFRSLGRGPITNVTAVVPWNPDDPGVTVHRIDYSSGDVGLYEGIWDAPGPWAVTVTTRDRRWELKPLERASHQNRGERQLHAHDPHEWDTAFKPGLRAQAEHAVAAALGRLSDSVPLDDAFETMQLIHRMFIET